MRKLIKVKEVMSTNPVVAKPDNRFSQVRRLFIEYGIHHLPIVETGDILIGVISSADVIRAIDHFLPKLEKFDNASIDAAIQLRDLMSPDPVRVRPDDTLHDAALLLTEHKFHSLPVTEEGRIVGIITTRDIVRAYAED